MSEMTHMMGAAMVLLLAAGCATGDRTINSLNVRSTGYLMHAGTGNARAGFAGGLGYATTENDTAVALPMVQGFVGSDLGRWYALHSTASTSGLWIDGAFIAVNDPEFRFGIAHGIGGNLRAENSSAVFRGAVGGGPYAIVGDDSPFLVAIRYDVVDHLEILPASLRRYENADDFDLGSTLGGTVAIAVTETPATTAELAIRRTAGEGFPVDVTTIVLALTIGAEVAR